MHREHHWPRVSARGSAQRGGHIDDPQPCLVTTPGIAATTWVGEQQRGRLVQRPVRKNNLVDKVDPAQIPPETDKRLRSTEVHVVHRQLGAVVLTPHLV